ncbi:MAG: YhhA family cyclophane-containing RiPP [Fusobacteriaceae bacterium]
MEATVTLDKSIIEKLISIDEVENSILSRLKESLINKKENLMMSGYSRMHNRHNRS